METLIEKNGFIYFTYEILKKEEHYIEAKIYEVSGWNVDEKNTPCDFEEYMQVLIKWDGCSHVYFSDDGYKHLCGKRFWDFHCEVMKKTWEVLTPLIESFDKETAE